MADAKPPLVAELVWSDGLRFDATSRANTAVVDGDSKAGPSPMQYAAIGLAGCMAADVVDIIRKGRPFDHRDRVPHFLVASFGRAWL